MLRRQFMSATIATPLLAQFTDARQASQGGASSSPGFYAWRQFILRNGTQGRRLTEFLQQAAIPALNRAGVQPIGIFETIAGPAAPSVFTLAPYPSLEAFAATEETLERDAEFNRLAAPYFAATAADPVYVRQEVSLLHAFPNVPRIEVPKATAAKGPRLFELRVYESHNEAAHRRKMEMFTRLGELEIFRRVGLTPVFFGRTIAGGRMPNFTYMLVHESLAAREKSWDGFRSDPEWKKLASTPGYADAEIVTNITTWFMRPSPASQV
jgi:NIPSNAP